MIEGLKRYAGGKNSAESRLMKANKPSKSMDAIRRSACPTGLDRLKKIHSEGESQLSTLIKQCSVLLEVI